MENLKNKIKKLGWNIYEIDFCDGKGWELEKYSPAGEDFIFSIEHNQTVEKAIENIKEYANNLCIDCTYCINNIRFTEEKYYNYINSIKNGTILNTLYFTSYNKLKEILEIAKFYNNKEIQIECEKLLIIKKLEN